MSKPEMTREAVANLCAKLRAIAEDGDISVNDSNTVCRAYEELSAITAAIGSTRFMDPPDGGDVSLADQVRRMRAELEAKEVHLAALENGKAGLADATKESPPVSEAPEGRVATLDWIDRQIASAKTLMKTSVKRGDGYANFAAHDAHKHLTAIRSALTTPPAPSTDALAKAVEPCVFETWEDVVRQLRNPPSGDYEQKKLMGHAAIMIKALAEEASPAPAQTAKERPRSEGYISADNGQGMGLPERCVRFRCGGEIVYRPDVPYSKAGDNVCSKCGASYGSDK